MMMDEDMTKIKSLKMNGIVEKPSSGFLFGHKKSLATAALKNGARVVVGGGGIINQKTKKSFSVATANAL